MSGNVRSILLLMYNQMLACGLSAISRILVLDLEMAGINPLLDYEAVLKHT